MQIIYSILKDNQYQINILVDLVQSIIELENIEDQTSIYNEFLQALSKFQDGTILCNLVIVKI